MGNLMKGRTRILVTHHVGLCLRGAAYIAVMKNGFIIGSGTPTEVMSQRITANALLEDDEIKLGVDEVTSSDASSATVRESDEEIDSEHGDQKEPVIQKKKAAGKLVKDEERAEGKVPLKVYLTYFRASGGFWFWFLVLAIFAVMHAMAIGQDNWLRIWSEAYESINTNILGKPSVLN
jgi:ABC-type multidrug transport system ATPase subunit